ncbi:low-density lipoprotein receptor-related protein 4-like [Pomacea canaliculata]|uniref:low-density lipoprotein receptor-related protein 4-like n=1 Tax=Pomacea canaliculata TaxID=400727 RepID=UPI000D730482|nr:low-density lipoprotein receptor-related protein 4-like [Pomacea canaliculata]
MNGKVSEQMKEFPSVAIRMITLLILSFITFGIQQQVQASTDGTTTGSTMTASYLVTSSSTSEPTKLPACGGVYNASSGFITSPLYPRQYPPDQDCVYIINATIGYRITVLFLNFEVLDGSQGCTHDYLQIRDGGLITSPLMDTYCGTTLYRKLSSSNILWIKFHSDSSQSGAGFQIQYTTAVIPQTFFLFTTDYPRIYREELYAYSLTEISPSTGLQSPDGINYDQMKNYMYWINKAEKTIRSANMDGSNVRLFHNLGPDAVPAGMCLDALSRLIFYTDAGNKVIGMITMYSNTHRIVINSSLDMPKDIELDKHNGVMYWSDRGATPTIERANYDGTGRQTLVSGGEYLNQPNAIALDTNSGRLYWADGGTQKVGWVDLEGRNTKVIIHREGSRFCGMDIYLNDLFISDWGNETVKPQIYRYGTDGNYQHWVAESDVRLNDIRVYSEEAENKGPNGCGNNNGGCSYICIPTPGNRSKCLTDGTESTKGDGINTDSTMTARDLVTSSTTAIRDGIKTDSTMTARDLVTSSTTGDPTKLPGTESTSTKTVIITAVCVVVGVVVVIVVVAVVVFKLRWRENKPNIPLESLLDTPNPAFDAGDIIYGKRGCEQPETFKEKSLVLSRGKQALSYKGDYLTVTVVEDPSYDDLVSVHDADESSCQQPVTFTQGALLPYMANREQATAPSDGYSNLTDEEEHFYDEFLSSPETE